MDDKMLNQISLNYKLTSDEENTVLERFSNSLSLDLTRLKLFKQNYGLCTLNTDIFNKENSLSEECVLFFDLYYNPIKILAYEGIYFHRFYIYNTYYQYLIYYKDYKNYFKPTGISLSPYSFEKYFKIIEGYKFENSDCYSEIKEIRDDSIFKIKTNIYR